MKTEESTPWIVAAVILGLAVLVSLLSGCASQPPRYEAAVQVETRGDEPVVVASFKVMN